MLIETKGGREFRFNEFPGWTKKAGFAKLEFIQLVGLTGAAVAYK